MWTTGGLGLITSGNFFVPVSATKPPSGHMTWSIPYEKYPQRQRR
jgi:hypothetical protein